MADSPKEFRQRYLSAASELGVPPPSDQAIMDDYEAYKYGNSLIRGETRLFFYKANANKLSWDVGPI